MSFEQHFEIQDSESSYKYFRRFQIQTIKRKRKPSDGVLYLLGKFLLLFVTVLIGLEVT